MAVAVARLHPRLLVSGSLAMFALIFASLVVLESPGLGLGHFFYLPIAMLAIVGGPRDGLLAGLTATALYTIAIVANDEHADPRPPDDELSGPPVTLRDVRRARRVVRRSGTAS